jgi:hypothetical protein
VRPTIRKTTLPTKERVFKSPDAVEDASARPKITNQDEFESYVKKHGNFDGILFLNAQNNPVGIMPMPVGKLGNEAVAEVIRVGDSLNAAAMLINSKKDIDKGNRLEFFQGIIDIADDIKVFDVIVEGRSTGMSSKGKNAPTEQAVKDLKKTTIFARRKEKGIPKPAAIPKATLDKMIETAQAEMFPGLKGKTEVHAKESDLPKSLQKIIQDNGASGDFVGLYHDGKIYFVAENIAAPDALTSAYMEWLVRHEGRHAAFDAILGSEKARMDFFTRVSSRYSREVEGYLADKELEPTPESRAMAAEEVLVNQVRLGNRSRLIDQFVAKAAALARKLFPGVKITHAEIRRVIARADRMIEGNETAFVGAGKGTRFAVRAWHGSRHAFDKFSMEAIGTGEGQQAFGHGLYFTDAREIAEFYADGETRYDPATTQVLRESGYSLEKAKQTARDTADKFQKKGDAEIAEAWEEIAAELDRGGRNLYRVTLHKDKRPGDYKWLDWDKPLSKSQIAEVKKVAESEGVAPWGDGKALDLNQPGITGKEIYQAIARHYQKEVNPKGRDTSEGRPYASAFLLRAGIDGIRYPAGTLSALESSGTNYVVFDDAAVTIDEHVRFARADEAGAEASRRAEARKEWAGKGTRSKYFKKWFGDWEAAEQYSRVIEMPAMPIESASVDKQAARKAYQAVGSAVNQRDGRRVLFVNNAFKKILGHRQRDLMLRIIPQFKPLLEKAEPIYSESERDPAKHNNIIAHHNYLSKVNDPDTGDYWVRFTVREANKPEGNELHNAFVSSVEITRAESKHHLSGIRAPAINAQSSPIDYKLMQWLEKVKADHDRVSKVVDEQGKPMVAYHATTADFTEFEPGRGREGTIGGSERQKVQGSVHTDGIWFTPWTGEVSEYISADVVDGQWYNVREGSSVIPAYLNIRNPKKMAWARARLEKVADLVKEGYDGVHITDNDNYVAFRPEQIKSAIGNAGTFDAISPDVRFARTSERPWPDNFPNATLHTSQNKMAKHPQYEKAKKRGDIEAGNAVVRDLAKPERIMALKEKHPDAIVVAVHAEEADGRNTIPVAFSSLFRDAGFAVDESIVQINRAHRTKKDSPLRLVIRPEFGGEVKAGRQYIIVDDALGQGGTVSELRHFIENNGGEVVHISALTSGIFGAKIHPDAKIIQSLKEKFGHEELRSFLREFNIAGSVEVLTNKEARFIYKQPSLDTLRNRILAAAQEANIEPAAWQEQGPVREEVIQGRPAGEADTPEGQFARPSDLPAHLKRSDYGAPVERAKQSGAQIRKAVWGDDRHHPQPLGNLFKSYLSNGGLPANITFDRHEPKMRVTQRALMLPQWIAKYHPETFGQLYARTKKRVETRNDMNTKDVTALDSFFKLRGDNLDAARDVIWAIDGQEIKGVPDSLAVDEQRGLHVNEESYPALEKWIVDNLGVSMETAKEVVQVRRVLDQKWVQIDNLLARSAEVDKNLIDQFRKDAKHKKNYFPHVRHGTNYLQIRNEAGEVVYRSHFDTGLSLTQQRAAAKELEKIFGKHPEYKDKGLKVRIGRNEKLPEESIYDTPIPTDAIMQILKTAAQKAGPDMAHMFENVLPEMVSDVMKMRGFGAHAIHRHNIPGHETRDIQKVLYQYLTGANGWMTKMEASRDYSKVLAHLDAKKDPELYKACKNYVTDMLRNSDQHDRRIAKAKSLFFAKYLGGSIKTPILNLTQVIVAGTARLSMETKRANARYIGTTGKMLVDALNGKKTLTEEQRRFLWEFFEKGLSGAQFTEEVSGQLMRDPVASGWDRLVKFLGVPMALSERFNRTTVGLTAFNIAREGKITNPKTLAKFGRKKGEAFSYEQALEFAKEINTDTNFDFGRHNRPEFVRAEKSPLLRYVAGTGYTFRFFVHNLLSLWKWQWKQGGTGQRALMRSLAAVVAFGGLTSFPLYKTFMTAMRQLTGDDWEEKTIDRLLPDDEDMDWFRDLALYGLPTLGGTTLGSSMSIEMPILARYRVDQPPIAQGTRLFAEAVGIPYAMMVDMERAVSAAYNRDPLRAMESILPPVLANPLRAHRAYSEGLYTHTGRPIVLPGEVEPRQITTSEAIGQAFGFQPVTGQKSWEISQKIGDLRAFKVRKQRNFANRLAKAVNAGNQDEVGKIIKEVAEWNRRQAETGRFEYIIDLKHALATRMQGRQPPAAMMPYAMRLRERAGM